MEDLLVSCAVHTQRILCSECLVLFVLAELGVHFSVSGQQRTASEGFCFVPVTRTDELCNAMRIGRLYKVIGIPALVHQWPNMTWSVEANSIQLWEPKGTAEVTRHLISSGFLFYCKLIQTEMFSNSLYSLPQSDSQIPAVIELDSLFSLEVLCHRSSLLWVGPGSSWFLQHTEAGFAAQPGADQNRRRWRVSQLGRPRCLKRCAHTWQVKLILKFLDHKPWSTSIGSVLIGPDRRESTLIFFFTSFFQTDDIQLELGVPWNKTSGLRGDVYISVQRPTRSRDC